jgi:hypothetical protein
VVEVMAPTVVAMTAAGSQVQVSSSAKILRRNRKRFDSWL